MIRRGKWTIDTRSTALYARAWTLVIVLFAFLHTCWRFQSLIANLAGSNQAVRNVSGAVAMKPGMPIGSKSFFAGAPRP